VSLPSAGWTHHRCRLFLRPPPSRKTRTLRVQVFCAVSKCVTSFVYCLQHRLFCFQLAQLTAILMPRWAFTANPSADSVRAEKSMERSQDVRGSQNLAVTVSNGGRQVVCYSTLETRRTGDGVCRSRAGGGIGSRDGRHLLKACTPNSPTRVHE